MPARPLFQMDVALTRFVLAQPFFILATADERGEADCSYRGRQTQADGQVQPLLAIVDASTIVFPDFSGNHLYNSIGNLLRNPALRLLFVDFAQPARVRMTGRGRVQRHAAPAWARLWPQAQACVTVEVEHAAFDTPPDLPALRLAAAAPGA